MHPHHETHLESSQKIRDIVIGMSDGMTVPFALAAGLSGASLVNSTILTAGVAEMVAGAISMGLGGYLAGRTDVEHYQNELNREKREISQVPEVEKKEVRDIFLNFGVPAETSDALVESISKDQDRWLEFMMKFELGLTQPDEREAPRSALRIGGSYFIGGLVPLLPYWFTSDPQMGLKYSAVGTLLALFAFGYLKGVYTSRTPLRSAVQVAAIGAIAAAGAYFIAQCLQRWI